jgi:hypothetical protein
MMSTGETLSPTLGSGADWVSRWKGWLGGRTAAAVLLGLLWIVLVGSLRNKSLTFDEVVYAAAGYAQWHFDDYRIQPENGQLPERIAGLGLVLSLSPPPDPDPAEWRYADQWQIGGRWLYYSGLDAAAIGSAGRMACGLFAVALGALVWAWSKRLFGAVGGLLSLVLFVLNPTVLANGALMTSDMAAALFLTGAVGAIWALLARLTVARFGLCAGLLAALFLTKTSALLVLPIGLILATWRAVDGRPMEVAAGSFRRASCSPAAKAALFAAVAAAQALAVVVILWAAYGFRYSAAPASASELRFRLPWEYLLGMPPPQRGLQSLDLTERQKADVGAILAAHGANPAIWSDRSLDAVDEIRRSVLTAEQSREFTALISRPSPDLWAHMVEWTRRHHLLPEAWLYGLTDVFRRAQVRVGFLNGQVSLRGWLRFFPYAFLVKTPLVLFGVMALALASARLLGPRTEDPAGRTGLPTTLPLWVLFGVYWAAAVASHLNIGQRHLLPVYAPLFILCGSAGRWFDVWMNRPSNGRAVKGAPFAAGALAVLLLAGALETAGYFPNYLAYFNGIVRPSEGYRHLVDSSLDWGQDLPAAKTYIESRPAVEGPFYLSYFGAASPAYYGIGAHLLFSVTGLDWRRRPDWENLFLGPDEALAALPDIRRDWPDHDVLGVQRLGNSEVISLLKRPERLRLGAGTYLVSASMVQPVNIEVSGPWGPWTARYESTYQELRSAARPLMSEDPGERRQAIVSRPPGVWPDLLQRFEEYRFCRLAAFLRHRAPDAEINYSILVYHLSANEVASALDGPAPELALDNQAKEVERLPSPDKN